MSEEDCPREEWNNSGTHPVATLKSCYYTMIQVSFNPVLNLHLQMLGLLPPADWPCAPHLICDYTLSLSGVTGSYKVTRGRSGLSTTELTDSVNLAGVRAEVIRGHLTNLKKNLKTLEEELIQFDPVATQDPEPIRRLSSLEAESQLV